MIFSRSVGRSTVDWNLCPVVTAQGYTFVHFQENAIYHATETVSLKDISDRISNWDEIEFIMFNPTNGRYCSFEVDFVDMVFPVDMGVAYTRLRKGKQASGCGKQVIKDPRKDWGQQALIQVSIREFK